MRKSVNRAKVAGRPKGSEVRFAGITAFCREHGYAHQHVRLVLTGRRESARLRGLWSLWQERGKR